MKGPREKKKWGLILFIVFIMVGTTFSVVFFGFSTQAEVVRQNGTKFVDNGNPGQGKLWTAKISGNYAAFSFLPGEVGDIAVPEGLSNALQNRLEIDFTSDSNSTYKEAIALAEHQMSLTLSAYNVYLRQGFTANNTFNVPIITCRDSTSNVPVVYFRHGNSTRIYMNASCIIAEASANIEFIRLKDRLLYAVLGV